MAKTRSCSQAGKSLSKCYSAKKRKRVGRRMRRKNKKAKKKKS